MRNLMEVAAIWLIFTAPPKQKHTLYSNGWYPSFIFRNRHCSAANTASASWLNQGDRKDS